MSWTDRSSNEMFPIRNFFIRRFYRIAPMFYFAILLYVVVNGFSPRYWSPNGIKWWFVPSTALFLHGFHPETINSIVPGGWSIAVEMSFYLILPFLLPYIKSIKYFLFFFIISIFLYGLNQLIIPHLFTYPENQQYLVRNYSIFNFLGQLPVFFMGILCYLIFRKNYPRKQIAVVGGLLFVVLMLLFVYPTGGIPHHLIAGGLFAIFALLLARWPARLLVNRITTMLGKLSFSMYLMQFVVLKYFSRREISRYLEPNSASLLYFICVVLVVAFVSYYLYTYVEKPGIAMGKRLIEKYERDNARYTNIAASTDTV
jgi:peptidoglycan/LPS O-acetylase OafA/YrhL